MLPDLNIQLVEATTRQRSNGKLCPWFERSLDPSPGEVCSIKQLRVEVKGYESISKSGNYCHQHQSVWAKHWRHVCTSYMPLNDPCFLYVACLCGKHARKPHDMQWHVTSNSNHLPHQHIGTQRTIYSQGLSKCQELVAFVLRTSGFNSGSQHVAVHRSIDAQVTVISRTTWFSHVLLPNITWIISMCHFKRPKLWKTCGEET